MTALRLHLKRGYRAIPSDGKALRLGRQAVAWGLETLDLARIHECAVAKLELSRFKNGAMKRADIFFAEAITPIVETHRSARQRKIELNRLNDTLDRRTLELVATHHQLRRGVVRRKVMENAAQKNQQQHDLSLKESLRLQAHLRQLTHRALITQEEERKKISCELQDEIAQTLLGINVRLLSLKQESQSNTKGLKNEIASTQRLVLKSARSVRQFAHELDIQPPASSHQSIKTALRRCDAELPAAAGVVNRGRNTKSKPERRQKRPASAAREPIPISPAKDSFPVIAMAASVGGLKALSVILGSLPADFPAAIAIVMHISPEHKSLLAEILNRRTHLEVKQAVTGDILRQASVFVAPPNHHLFVVKGGRLRLSSSGSEKVHHARPSAEPLFASVARVYQGRAIAVVLTGGDGDGSFGVQIIKERGGKVIAQDRPTSQDFSMPETSIETGDVDFILPLKEIAPKLIELVAAGSGQNNGRTTAQRRGAGASPGPALRDDAARFSQTMIQRPKTLY